MRRFILALVGCALVVAISVASPALGGPSVAQVVKQVKKATKIGKSARRKANSARRVANSARGLAVAAQGGASTANSKADQALARPVVTPGGITTVTRSVAVAPEGVEVLAAICPSGQRVISGGVVSDVSVGGTWVDAASDDRTAWIGGAEDLSGGSGGTLFVDAHCVPTGRATVASRSSVVQKVRSEVRRYEARR